jgi:hypothetical protein
VPDGVGSASQHLVLRAFESVVMRLESIRERIDAFWTPQDIAFMLCCDAFG